MKSEIMDATPDMFPTDRGTCAGCRAWVPDANQMVNIWGGCARSGKITLHYGDTAYKRYSTDLQSCSAWEPK